MALVTEDVAATEVEEVDSAEVEEEAAIVDVAHHAAEEVDEAVGLAQRAE